MSSVEATFETCCRDLAMLVRQIQHQLSSQPRASTEITETARSLLLAVRDLRALASATPDAAILTAYKSLAQAVSALIQLARDDEGGTNPNTPNQSLAIKDATGNIVAAIRTLLSAVPKSLQNVPAAAFGDSTRRRRSRSLPPLSTEEVVVVAPVTSTVVTATAAAVAPSGAAGAAKPAVLTRAPSATSAPRPTALLASPPTTPKGADSASSSQQYQQAMSRLSQMLDAEISMVGSSSAAAAAAASAAPLADDDPPPPRKQAPSLSSRAPAQRAMTTLDPDSPRRLAAAAGVGAMALEQRLAEAQAAAKSAVERAARLERENEQMAATSSTALAEKTAEVEKLKRELKALKHATTTPPADLLASLQNRGETEAALEKLRLEHDEMVATANAEFARIQREFATLRSLVLDEPFDGWLAKQGGGNISRAWKDRFFVLRGAILAYFQDENDEKPSGFVHLANAVVERTSNSGRDFSFALRTPTRTYFIAASNQSQLDAWTSKLRDTIESYAAVEKAGAAPVTTMEALWKQAMIQKTKDQLLAAQRTKK